jgi:hypothetical protein
MEYLKDKFNNELSASVSDNGKEVVIGGTSFSALDILNTLDPEAYQDAFEDWLNQERLAKIDFADEILNKHDCIDRFNFLKKIHSDKKVIPFVGAGMSVASGYKTWTGFLRDCIKECSSNASEVSNLISSEKYEDAAELIKNSMPDGAFLEKISSAFSDKQKYSGPIQKLPYLFKEIVITSNFDRVLESVYEEAKFTFEEKILGADTQDLPQIAQSKTKILVKLHGNAHSSKNRVFTSSEYDMHYKDSASIKKVVRFFYSRTILFLGCSIVSDRFFKLMAQYVAEEGADNVPKHYSFMQLINESNRLEIRDRLAAANIYPIWYDGDHDECIEAFLEKLHDQG